MQKTKRRIQEGIEMYLSMLSGKQKENFLELAYQMAFIDNDFSEKERIMIESYCHEMWIAVPEVIRAGSINEIIESMKSECTILEKKIIIFEILGLALVDGNYDETERKVIEEITKIFEIEETFLTESEDLLKKYIDVQNGMNALVLN